MITGRRAQAFHELVESTSPSRARASAQVSSRESEYAELLELVGALRVTATLPAAQPDQAFVDSLRERLVAEAESVLAAAAAERDDTDARLRLRPTTPRTRRRQRRLAAVVSGVALVGVSTTVAVAAQTSLPGDNLYSVKRGLESARAELTFDRGARGRLLLHDAGVRLDEVQTLSREHADPARVNDALDAFSQQAGDGSDLLVSDYEATGDRSSVTALRTFAAESMARLKTLQSEVPPASLDSLLQAAQTLDLVQRTSLQTCPSCQGPVIGSVPSVLAQADQATAGSWQVVAPPRHTGVHHGTSGTPRLPHLPSQLPPASVTDPGSTGLAPPPPTAGDVQHTVQHLTDGLTGKHQDVASTISHVTDDLLDAVGAVGNQVAGALDTTVGGIQSILPSLP